MISSLPSVAALLIAVLSAIRAAWPKSRRGSKAYRLLPSPKTCLLAFVSFIFLYGALLTWLQYMAWRGSAFQKYFLPPYADIRYFLASAFELFWADKLIGLALSFLAYLAFLAPKAAGRKALGKEEALSLFLFFALSSWPGLAVTVPLFLLLAAAYNSFLFLVLKKKEASLLAPLFLSFFITFFCGAGIMRLLAIPLP